MNDFERLYINDVAVIVVNLTRCTIYDQKDFKKIIDEEIKSGQRKIIIDLSKCEYIGSNFCGAIIGTLNKIAEYKGELKIVEPENIREDIFTTTNCRELFDICKTSEDAIKSFEEDI